MLRERWGTLRARWVTLRARWVTLRARWVILSSAWFSACVPQNEDGCQIMQADGELNLNLSGEAVLNEVCWWHMKDGAVLGVHNGMIIEYDGDTLAPLGMVVSRDELLDRKVRVPPPAVPIPVHTQPGRVGRRRFSEMNSAFLDGVLPALSATRRTSQ
jgi:hypothetical protein